MTDNHKRPAPRDPIAIWDNILELVAEDDAQNADVSEGVRQWSQRLDTQVKSRIAALRRRLTPTDVEIQRDVKIPPEILAMDRNALVARLEIERRAGNCRWAHHELTGLSDESLRRTLTLAMKTRK